MAVNHWVNPWDTYKPPTESTHLIQGKMIVHSLSVGPFHDGPTDPDQIKYELCKGLIDYALRNNHIEFTKQQEIGGVVHYRARMFVTPDENVRILRIAEQKR